MQAISRGGRPTHKSKLAHVVGDVTNSSRVVCSIGRVKTFLRTSLKLACFCVIHHTKRERGMACVCVCVRACVYCVCMYCVCIVRVCVSVCV